MRSALCFLLAVVCGLAAAMALIAPASAAERKVALVIGNAAYKNSSLDIPNARNDAEDVASALKALGFEVLLETDADLAQAGKAIQQFARLSVGADASLFFYAGHAIQYQGRNYLLPVDAEVKDEISLPFETIAVDSLRAVLDRSSGVKIMVLDACRSNPIVDRLARMASAAPAIDPGERTRGLERSDRSEGLIIAFAAAPGDVAFDGKERNSPFTRAFLKRLAEPGLEVEMMFRRVAGDVRAATGGRQRPETYVSLSSEYYLNETDRFAWEEVKGADDLDALRTFVERFPSSFHAIEARYRIRALERALAAGKERALKEAEAARREKEAAAQEAARLAAAEATRLKAEEACRTERAAFARAGPRDADALRRLAAGACGEVVTAAQKRLATLEATLAAEAESCRREAESVGRLGDVDALRALAQSACAPVKAQAAEKLAAIEADLAKAAELCRREDAALKGLIERGDAGELAALRARSQCLASLPAIARGLQMIAEAAKAACDRDAAALQAIPERDGAALKSFVARNICEPVRTTAEARLRELETVVVREAAQCRSEEAALKGLIERADAAGVRDLRAGAQCAATAAAADKGLREIAAAASALCAREDAALGALAARDVAGLGALVERSACPTVRSAAAQKLAAAQAALRRDAELCARDEALWKGLSASGDLAALEAFRKQAQCEAATPAIDRRIAEVKSVCRAESAELARVGSRDVEGLRGLAGGACDEVKAEAGKRLAALEAASAREAGVCARDAAAFAALAASGDRGAIEAFRASAECASVKAQAGRRLADLAASCRSEEAALGGLGASDAAGLEALAGKAQCREIKAEAAQRLARLEADRARQAELCARDEALLKGAGAADGATLAALRARVECASVAAALDKQLGEFRQACAREKSALAGLADAAAARAFLQGAVCDEVVNAGRARLAALEAEDARSEEACRREDFELATLKTRGAEAREKLAALKQGLVCARLRPDVEAALAALPAPPEVDVKAQLAAQIRATQAQLRRLGCFSAAESGVLDAGTKSGLARYFKAKGAPAGAPKVTVELVARLESETEGLCAAPSVAEPAKPRVKKDVVRLPEADEPAKPKPAREKAGKPAPLERASRPPPKAPERAQARAPEPARAPPAAQSSANRAPPRAASPIGVGF